MEKSDRHMATILFSDMANFTAIMDEDEMQAFYLQKRNLSIHQLKVSMHNGTLMKEIGDGMVASFNNPLDAVHCALDLRDEVDKIEGLNLRMGVHIGHVDSKDNDIFGDGINIASRVQDQAKIGQVLITNSVYESIQNHDTIKATFFAENILNNVPDPLKIYEVNRK